MAVVGEQVEVERVLVVGGTVAPIAQTLSCTLEPGSLSSPRSNRLWLGVCTRTNVAWSVTRTRSRKCTATLSRLAPCAATVLVMSVDVSSGAGMKSGAVSTSVCAELTFWA